MSCDTINILSPFGGLLETYGFIGFEQPAPTIKLATDGYALGTFGLVWGSDDIWDTQEFSGTSTWSTQEFLGTTGWACC